MDYNRLGYSENLARKIAYQINSGYWKVFNRCFFNKADCLRLATALKKFPVTYHFFDEVYTSIDWKKPIERSLKSLYFERAKHIREKYKYVSLLLSGGADSTTVLNIFIDNGIHLDEVITFYPIEASDKLLKTFDPSDMSSQNQIFEYYYAALPVLNNLKKYHPNIKITVIDYSREVLSLIDSSKLHKIFLSGCNANGVTVGYYLAYKEISKHKDSCVVLGIDKPRISYDTIEKKFKAYFLDFNTIHGHFPKETFDDAQPATEYFYHSPDFPLIPIKQCQDVVNKLYAVLDPKHVFYDQIIKKSLDNRNLIIDVHHAHIKKMIYPDWDTNIFQVEKPYSYFFFEMNNWMYEKNLVSSRIKDFTIGQVEELVHGVDPKFITYKNSIPQKFNDIVSTRISIS